jgi:hypothetical protein
LGTHPMPHFAGKPQIRWSAVRINWRAALPTVPRMAGARKTYQRLFYRYRELI